MKGHDMDRGTIFTQRIDIMPGSDGSFVVRVGPNDYEVRMADGMFGFTTVGDLMQWLTDHAQAFEGCAGEPSEPSFADRVDAIRAAAFAKKAEAGK